MAAWSWQKNSMNGKASKLRREDNCTGEVGGVRKVGVVEGGAYIQQNVLVDESQEIYSSELLYLMPLSSIGLNASSSHSGNVAYPAV